MVSMNEEEVEKDLGVWISSDMKCSQQCIQTFNKASGVMRMIKRTIRFKEVRITISSYKTLVRPHVEYCVSAWTPYYKKDKEFLEIVQRRFTGGIGWISRRLGPLASVSLKLG